MALESMIEIKGQEQILKNLLREGQLMTDGAIRGLEIGANLVATDAKSRHPFGRGRSAGELKIHPNPRYYSWTGMLTNSIRVEPVKINLSANEISVKIGAFIEYAAKVELGGPNSRAFPYMQPAIDNKSPEIMAVLINNMRIRN